MTGPTASTIIAARWRVSIALKLVAMLLAIAAFAWAAIRIQPFQYQQRLAAGGFAPIPNATDLDAFGVSIALGIAALLVFLASMFALRWIVPVPRPLCPGCKYDIAQPEGSNCPECGLALGQEQPRR